VLALARAGGRAERDGERTIALGTVVTLRLP
jgi:hypothetical protein